MPELQFYTHKRSIPIDHLDDSITSSKLRYAPNPFLLDSPWFIYYYASQLQVFHHENPWHNHTVHITKNKYTDLGFIVIMTGTRRIYIRTTAPIDSTVLEGYTFECNFLTRYIRNNPSSIARWTVSHCNYHLLSGCSVSGSSFKIILGWLDVSNYKNATAVATATDTTFSSGYFGPSHVRNYDQHYLLTAWFVPPFSKAPSALAVLETENLHLYQRLKRIDEIDSSLLPDWLVRDYYLYKRLVNKGYSKEEIESIWRNRGIQKQIIEEIDMVQVNWGAVDVRPQQYYGFVALFGSNPYNPNAVLEQIEYARSKNLAVYKPRDYSYTDFYRREKERRDWLITENEFAYQLFGREDLELRAVADFYWREVVELNRVPLESQVIRTIELWVKRAIELNLHDVVVKLNSVLKK